MIFTDLFPLINPDPTGQRKGFLHLIVPKSRFRLGEGSQEALSLYTFGTHTAKHYFCSTCGIGSFYIPRSSTSSPPPPLAHVVSTSPSRVSCVRVRVIRVSFRACACTRVGHCTSMPCRP
jgi:hypothetical protein